MVAGHLQEKYGIFYIVLSYKDSSGKRKVKWESTGLPVKKNKKKAEALLLERRRTFVPPQEQAEVKLDDQIHDLRHSCASLLLSNGVPMKQIQEWLGHSDFSTTANIYAHLDYSSKLSSAQAMAASLSLGGVS